MMAPPPGQQVHVLSPEQQSVLIAGLQGMRGPGYLTPYRAPNIRPSNNIPSASSLSGSEEDLAFNGQRGLGAAPSKIAVPESRNGHDRIKPVISNNGVDGVVKKPKPIPLPKPKNYIASRPQIKPKPRQIPDVAIRQTVSKLETSPNESRPRNSRGKDDSGHCKRTSLQRNHPVKDNWVKLDDDERTAAYRRSGKPLIAKKPVFLIKPGGENIQIQLRREESTASWDSHDSSRSEISLATKPNSSEFQRTGDGSETGFQKAADVESRLENKQLREISRLDGDSKMRIDGTTGEDIYTPTSPRASVSSSVEREQILSDSNKVNNSKPMVSLRIMSKQTQKDFVRYGDNANIIDDWSSDTPSQSADKYPNLGGAGKITRDRPAAKRDRSSNQMQDLPQFDPSSAAVSSPSPNPGKTNIVSKLKNLFPKRLSSDEMLSASDAERLLRESEAQKVTRSKSLEESTDKPQPKKKKIINQKFKNIKKRLKLVRNENRAAAVGKTLSDDDDDEAQSGDTLDGASDDFDSDDAEYFDDFFGQSDTLESNRYPEHGSGNTSYGNKPDYRKRDSYETAEIIQSSELRVSLPDPVSETTLCPSSTSVEEDWGQLENGVYDHCRDEEETVESPEEEDGRIPDSTRNERGNSSSDDYEEVVSNDQWDEDSEVPEPVDMAYTPIWEDWEGHKVTRTGDVYQPSMSEVDRGDHVINGAAYGNTPEDHETSSDPRKFDDHIYDLTPSSKTKIAYKYSQIKRGSQKSSITEDPTPVLFAIEDREPELVGSFQALSVGSEGGQRVDEEAEDAFDDGASTDSEASCGVAYTEEEETRDRAPRKQHSGRYTQDGRDGAVFSFTENIAHHWNQENGTSSALSPGFEKRGPKLPPRMAPPIPSRDPKSPYHLVTFAGEEEMDMSGKNDEEKDLPLYQVYTDEVKRKETLLLRHAAGMEKRKQIMKKMQNDQAPSDSGESWGSGSGENSGNSRGTVDGPEPGTEYYADWNLDEPAAGYGLMVAKEVQEDFYEPLDYEDYLESKRKKLFPLWRDQQAVADSGLLETLTLKEQELQEALYEIITSEHSYLRSISLVVDHFMDSKQLERLLGPSDYRKLFSNIKEVRSVSQRLYDDIEAYHDLSLTLEHIPKLILNHLELFDCYIGYCGNNQHQIALMNKIKKTPEVKAVIDSLEKHPDCQHLDLMSFLMLPFQRITRLPLLMKAVVHRSSSDLAIEAQQIMEKTTQLVHECNNSAKRMEDCKDLAEVLASLDHKDGVKHVELTQHSVIKKKGSIGMLYWEPGIMGKKKISIKKKVFIIATTEKVIIAKEKLRSDQKRFQVQDWCMANRVTIKDISEEQKKDMFPSGLPPEAKCIFRVTFLENNQKQTEDYDLCTQNESDKERWLQALSTSKLGENGEIIYDNFDCPQVICIQPVTRTHDIDELRLELHDRLDVLKKMEDGWLEGRRQRDGKVGWFHERHIEEIETDHTVARLLKQRHRMGEQSDEETYFGIV